MEILATPQMEYSPFIMLNRCAAFPECPRGMLSLSDCVDCDDLLRKATSQPIDKSTFERHMEMVVHLNKQKQCFLALAARAKGIEFKWDLIQGLDQDFVTVASRWVEKNLDEYALNPDPFLQEEHKTLQRLDFFIRWCGAALPSVTMD